jgi:hypothetical protein
MVRPKREKPSVQISVRVEPELAADLDQIAADLRVVNVGGVGSRVDAVRAALELGVVALRKQIDAKLSASRPSSGVAGKVRKKSAATAPR